METIKKPDRERSFSTRGRGGYSRCAHRLGETETPARLLQRLLRTNVSAGVKRGNETSSRVIKDQPCGCACSAARATFDGRSSANSNAISNTATKTSKTWTVMFAQQAACRFASRSYSRHDLWRVRLVVRTQPSQGWCTGSTPVRAVFSFTEN